MRPSECPKCHGTMSEGMVVVGNGWSMLSRWQPSPNNSSNFWGAKVRRAEALPVVTYRCTRCGFLESYAPPA